MGRELCDPVLQCHTERGRCAEHNGHYRLQFQVIFFAHSLLLFSFRNYMLNCGIGHSLLRRIEFKMVGFFTWSQNKSILSLLSSLTFVCPYDECLICVNTGVHISQSIHRGQKTTSGVILYLPPCFQTGFLLFSLCLSGQLGYVLLWSLLFPSSTSLQNHWYDRCILLYLALCGFCGFEVKSTFFTYGVISWARHVVFNCNLRN